MKLEFGNIEYVENIKDAECITHAGTFHADEVFATALLSIIFNNIKITRVNEIDLNTVKKNQIVYDVGLGELDHHQKGGNGKRENGVMYASCGLIWRKYGHEILKKIGILEKNIDYILSQIDKNLIEFIDANDNGVSPDILTEYKYVTVSTLIADFNPNWNDITSPNDKFLEAVEFAKTVLKNVFESEISKFEAKEKVEEAIEASKDNIMILERYMPWKEFVILSQTQKAKELLYVVFPSKRGGYSVYAVPKTVEGFENRKSFPKSWSGLRDEKLQEVTGVKTARFCHTACFLCTAETKEDVIKLAYIAKDSKE